MLCNPKKLLRFRLVNLVRYIHQQNETSEHKWEISKWFTKVYLGPVLSCGYFGTVERITGATKHTGSNLYQKKQYTCFQKFPIKKYASFCIRTFCSDEFPWYTEGRKRNFGEAGMVIDKLNASKYFLMGGKKQSTPFVGFWCVICELEL